MMQRQTFALALAAAAAVGLFAAVNLQGQQAGEASIRMAVVDVQRVFDRLHEKAAVEAEVTQMAEDIQREDQERQERINALRSDLSILNPDAAAHRETQDELEEKLVEYQTWKQLAEHRLEREMMLRVEQLYGRITGATERLAKENGYDMVVQKDDSHSLRAGDQRELMMMIRSRKLLYADEKLDITDEVIQVCNNEFNNRRRQE